MAEPTDKHLRATAKALEGIARARLVRTQERERRYAQRIPFHQVMRLAATHDARVCSDWSWEAMLSLDVSQQGAGLMSPANSFRLGSSIVVNCFPGGVKQLFMPGRVVRVDEVIPGLSAIGIQFQFRSDFLDGIRLFKTWLLPPFK